jgi:hypothetical protein
VSISFYSDAGIEVHTYPELAAEKGLRKIPYLKLCSGVLLPPAIYKEDMTDNKPAVAYCKVNIVYHKEVFKDPVVSFLKGYDFFRGDWDFENQEKNIWNFEAFLSLEALKSESDLNQLALKTSGQVATLTTFDVFGVFTGFVIGKFDEANDIIEGVMMNLTDPQNFRPESINDFFWQEDIGEWGSTCLCPNGDVYFSGCLDQRCASYACLNGKPGRIQRTAGPWSHKVTVCSSTDTLQTYPAKIFVAMKNQRTQEWI